MQSGKYWIWAATMRGSIESIESWTASCIHSWQTASIFVVFTCRTIEARAGTCGAQTVNRFESLSRRADHSRASSSTASDGTLPSSASANSCADSPKDLIPATNPPAPAPPRCASCASLPDDSFCRWHAIVSTLAILSVYVTANETSSLMCVSFFASLTVSTLTACSA